MNVMQKWPYTHDRVQCQRTRHIIKLLRMHGEWLDRTAADQLEYLHRRLGGYRVKSQPKQPN